MKDNELYTFFKDRKQAFDETPNDILWAKIESGVNNSPQPQKSIKPTTILYILGSLAVITGVAAYLFFTSPENIKTQQQIELPAQVTPIVSTEKIPLEKPVNDTVKRKKALKVLSIEPKQYVPFRKIESQNGVQERAQQLIDELFDTDYKTDKLPGRTIVTVKGKISTKVFQKLIAQTLEKNQTAYGDVIIVKAFGHKTFRKVIKISESEAKIPTNGIIYRDSSYIPFRPSRPILTSEMLAKDSLDIEYIQFKDTEPKITPQKGELLDSEKINNKGIYHGILVTDSVKAKANTPVLQGAPSKKQK